MQQTAPTEVEGTDCDLVLYLQLKDEDKESAHLALNKLIVRHHEYFITIGLKYLSVWPDLADARGIVEEFVNDMWKRVYDAADSYSGADLEDADQSRKVFRAWAGAILKNLILDWLKLARNKEAQKYFHVGLEGCESQQGELVERDETKVQQAEHQTLFENLSEKEADVMREILLYLGTDLLSTNLPHGAIDEIAKRLNTQPENVRQLKSRAIKKIRSKYQNSFGG